MARAVLAFLVFVPLLSACASWQTAAEVRPGVDFARYRTFTFVPRSEMPPADPGMQNEAVAEWLRATIEEGLGDRTLARDDAAPDLRVSFRVSVTDALGETLWGYGYGARDGGFTTSNYREGSLVIEVADAGTRERVWLGVARGVVPTDSDREERLRGVIRDLLALLPAGR
jgi:hypothetical protein